MANGEAGAHRVTIAGGGIAALEAVLALRDLVPGAQLELVAPRTDAEYRPLSVLEPFALGEMPTFDLARFAEEQRVSLRRDTLVGVEADGSTLITGSGGRDGFDVLLVTVGATAVDAIPGALTFTDARDRTRLALLVDEYARAQLDRLLFVVPPGAAWSLPAYELALMMHADLVARDVAHAELAIATPEPAPLAIFGKRASAAVSELLELAGIRLHTGVVAERAEAGGLVTAAGRIETDRVVALPRLLGPRLHGLPSDERGFIPTDPHGRVEGMTSVYAAGDATTYPVKQGGLATQQADAAAEAIAAQLGAAVQPRPFEPVLRGLLMTGAAARYLEADPGDDAGKGARRTLWSPSSKVFGRYLLPYLGGVATSDGLPVGPDDGIETEAVRT